jgi:hypothetical protein
VDCTALEGVADVRCVDSRCLVSSCERGWTLDALDNVTQCVPSGTGGRGGAGSGFPSGSGSMLGSALTGAEKVLGW